MLCESICSTILVNLSGSTNKLISKASLKVYTCNHFVKLSCKIIIIVLIKRII